MDRIWPTTSRHASCAATEGHKRGAARRPCRMEREDIWGVGSQHGKMRNMARAFKRVQTADDSVKWNSGGQLW